MKILAVDDDPVALDLLVESLSRENYEETTKAESGARALHLIKHAASAFDCILLDIKMPGLDGVELCRLIRELPLYHTTPIIMITGLHSTKDVRKAMTAGATDYVTKPFNQVDLCARLRGASILADLLRKHNDSRKNIANLKEELDSFNRKALSDPISLDPVPGVSTDLQLENNLLKLPKGIFNFEILTLAVANIDDFYEALTATEFRTFLNCIAGQILQVANPESANVAYFGDGIFALVAKKSLHTPTLPSDIHTKVSACVYPELARLAVRPIFLFAKPEQSGFWSSRTASDGLNDALFRIQQKRAEIEHSKSLSELRGTLQEDLARRPKKIWFHNPLVSLKQKCSPVTPRRPSTGPKTSASN